MDDERALDDVRWAKVKPKTCTCGCDPDIEYKRGVFSWRPICPNVGCVNHRRIFPHCSSLDGAIRAWNREAFKPYETVGGSS